jgi:hypothetical protein
MMQNAIPPMEMHATLMMTMTTDDDSIHGYDLSTYFKPVWTLLRSTFVKQRIILSSYCAPARRWIRGHGW